ncbi:MAG: hypothetical protein J6W52_01870 [Bacteroidaceae bacterium]|nr:hypothetical protein [Bacteroidaceae bacterium]
MKKIYKSPRTLVITIASQTHLMQPSIIVDGDTTVSNSSDIGFTKENSSHGGNSVWDDEW